MVANCRDHPTLHGTLSSDTLSVAIWTFTSHKGFLTTSSHASRLSPHSFSSGRSQTNLLALQKTASFHKCHNLRRLQACPNRCWHQQGLSHCHQDLCQNNPCKNPCIGKPHPRQPQLMNCTLRKAATCHKGCILMADATLPIQTPEKSVFHTMVVRLKCHLSPSTSIHTQ